MKKFITIFLILGLFALVSFSQNETVDKSLSYSNTWFTYDGSASDSIQSGDSIFTYTIEKFTDTKTFVYFYIECDSVAGTGAPVTYYLQNKVFQDETFSDVDTIEWTAGADTSFIFETTTSDIADYWRIYRIGSTSTFNAYETDINGKFVKQ